MQNEDRPKGSELVVTLAVSGARVEPAAYGAQLVLEQSGRKIAYSRLRATDARGKELPARIEVVGCGQAGEDVESQRLTGVGAELGATTSSGTPTGALAVVVDDAEALYPVRIDPTFSDANWVSLGGLCGVNAYVAAAVVDGSGNLYIGESDALGGFGLVEQWNGSSWSPLGSGMGGSYPHVNALAVSGGTLYAGGNFTTAGTNVSAYAAMANLPVSLAIITADAALGFTNGAFGFDVIGPPGSNVVIQASTELQAWIPLQTNLLGSGPLYFSDPQSPAHTRRFYRVQFSP